MYDYDGNSSNEHVGDYEVHYTDAEGYPDDPYITVGEYDISVESSEIETDAPCDWN